MDNIRESLLKQSAATRKDRFGRYISLAALLLIVVVVLSIFWFVASKGLATFFANKVNLWDFLTGTKWAPGQKDANGHPFVGAAPMIVGSFLVTLISALIATPFAIGTAVFMTEISPKRGAKILGPVTELLVGIPSVVYGFIGLSVIVPVMRHLFGGSGFGILAGAMVLFVMILPTVTSMTVDTLKSVPRHYRESSLALGATRWQMIYKVILRAATPGILTAVVFGMARAFGEALAVQMVVGNAALMPQNLTSPAATLTSVLTQGIGNTVMGSLENNALWSLALILLLMSLVFNSVIRAIAKKGAM
ncbi:phosphate ABC transporter permease subunit PstC [Weissella cibaria]|jgi:phosphate ABC transporter, permease protein PstC|uniref:Phosphate transport system permease protein n=1 Tax=Weissella cibaria TaxID=137591 RepID=A0A0D1K842_9LACO|nr:MULTISPECIES: phosphate ABC transporter permease subunit PstC [Weissella]ALI32791.1 phosphate ABC transporter permease [Weissella cibaria]APS26985.1 Phosphate transport system permease protein PstC [Weissella cibaria]APU62382.1 Phosphate transport system permease protein PstC [Weissella cibaria]APU64534.1 Phosphate transport system permease protein PstC [Weissella cibaria]ASS52087.1 Phosphate transport system permease protein PstC 1 [Weissella cibaria]